jgi:hypothetical protein
MNKWEYGEIYKKYNMDGEIQIGTGIVKVHDIFESLPKFMKQADCLFIDPPWNLSNLNTFYTKADRTDYKNTFNEFYNRLFECIAEIKPKTLFLEIGKEYLADFIMKCKEQYKYVTFYNSSYYHTKENKCYIIHCTNIYKEKNLKLDYIDEEDIIKYICENINFNCIGDLCMGRGLVGFYANMFNKKFVGTELNKKRLAVLLDRINNKI